DVGCDHCTVQRCVTIANAGYGYLSFAGDGAQYNGNVNNVYRFNIAFNDGLGAFRCLSGGSVTVNNGVCHNNRFFVNSASQGIKIEKNGGGMTWTFGNNDIVSSHGGTTDFI